MQGMREGGSAIRDRRRNAGEKERMMNVVKVTFGETTVNSKKERYRDAEMAAWIDEDNDLCLSVKMGREIKMIFMAPELLNGLVTMAMRKQHEASEMEEASSKLEKAELLVV